MKVYYIYLDLTNEIQPRVFYVGKGSKTRISDYKKRSKRWLRIVNKYGLTRKVLFGTTDEDFAFQEEIRLIREYKTFEKDWGDKSGWGANLTRGGEGTSGHKLSKSHRRKMLKANSGKNHYLFGKSPSKETKNKISEALKGKIVKIDTRENYPFVKKEKTIIKPN